MYQLVRRNDKKVLFTGTEGSIKQFMLKELNLSFPYRFYKLDRPFNVGDDYWVGNWSRPRFTADGVDRREPMAKRKDSRDPLIQAEFAKMDLIWEEITRLEGLPDNAGDEGGR